MQDEGASAYDDGVERAIGKKRGTKKKSCAPARNTQKGINGEREKGKPERELDGTFFFGRMSELAGAVTWDYHAVRRYSENHTDCKLLAGPGLGWQNTSDAYAPTACYRGDGGIGRDPLLYERFLLRSTEYCVLTCSSNIFHVVDCRRAGIGGRGATVAYVRWRREPSEGAWRAWKEREYKVLPKGGCIVLTGRQGGQEISLCSTE